jgi:hypothetical protein
VGGLRFPAGVGSVDPIEGVAMRLQPWAVCAATALALAMPASASAVPPVSPPEGSVCTFEGGITTCVQTLRLVSEQSVRFSDPSCPSGVAERRTVTTTTITNTTVFRGTRMVGEPQTSETTSTEEFVSCVDG